MAKTKKSNIDDLMASVGNLAKTVAKVKKTDERPQLNLDENTLKDFVNFSTIHAIFSDLKDHDESLKTQVAEKLFTLWKDLIWKTKSIPGNPRIESKKDDLSDITAIFQCFVKRDSLKYDPINDDSTDKTPIEKTVDLFVSLGIDPEKAESLVENELNFITETYIPFEELASGIYERDIFKESSKQQKEAARKILSFLMSSSEGKTAQIETLTDEERSMVIRRKNSVVVKDGFFERVFTYCDSREDLDIILSIIKPVFFLSHIKFAISDSEADKFQRKMKTVEDFFQKPRKEKASK